MATRLLNEFYAKHKLYGMISAIRGADGRLVPQGNQHRRRFQGREDAHRGLAGKVVEKLGVVPQQIAGGDISGAGKGHDRRGRMGRPYDDHKLGFQKVAKYYYYPAFWEGGPVIHSFVNLDKWNDLPKNYQAVLQDACSFANTNMLAKYDAKNPGDQADRLRRCNASSLQPGYSGRLLQGGSRSLRGEISAVNPDFKKVYDDQVAFSAKAICGCSSPSTPMTRS